MTKSCHHCGKQTDLRPYGPKGEWVCFDCAFSTPERKAATEQQFAEQLNAAGPVSLLTDNGPVPFEPTKGELQ